MQILQHALPAGSAAPECGEADTTGRSLGSKTQTETDNSHRSEGLAFEQAPRGYGKRLADVTAKLAMKGFSLYPLHDETLLVTRWNMTRTLPSVAAAERFLEMVGGAQA